MAFAVKWKGQYHSYDRQGQESALFTVDILDTNGGLDSEVDFKVNSLTISGQPNHEDHRCTIISTKCSMTMVIDRVGVEDFITNLALADEGRYWIRVYRGATMIFIGMVVVDGAFIEDEDYPYYFKVNAVDALYQLKNIEATASDIELTYGFSALDYIHGLFKLTDLPEFYTTETFLQTYGGWRSASQTDTTGNPFLLYAIHRKAFDRVQGDSEKKTKAIDVLDQILFIQHSRIYFSNGTYHIEQWPYRANNTSLERWRYDIDLNEISNDTGITGLNVTFDGVTLDRLRGGRQTLLHPLKEVRIKYQHDAINDYWALDNFYTVGTNLTENDVLVATATQKLYWGFQSRLENLEYSTTTGNAKGVIFRFTIKIGTKYLKKVVTGGTLANPTFGPISWETSLSYFEYVYYLPDYAKEPFVQANWETPNPLGSDFTVGNRYNFEISMISLEYLDMNGSRQSILGKYILNENRLFAYPIDGANDVTEITETTYYAKGAASNSRLLEIETIVGEGPEPLSVGGIRAKVGLFWEGNKEDWGSSSKNILQLLANSYMAFRKKPCHLLDTWTWIKTFWKPAEVIEWDSRKWAVLQYSYDTISEEIKGRWIEIAFDDTGLTEDKDEVRFQGDPFTPGGDPPSDPDRPVGNVDKLPDLGTEYHEEFDDVSASFVTTTTSGVLPDPGVVTADAIKRRVSVYASGVKQGYDKPFGYDIDFANDRVRFLDRNGTGYRNLLSEDVVLTIKPY
jgi:hypothetical protein